MINIEDTKPFENLVDEIIFTKKSLKNTVDLEVQINKLVYQLYDLTDEEITIVEKVSN